MTDICISKLTIIDSDNGLSPGQHQAIIWTNEGILLIRILGTNFSEILSEICTFSFKKMLLKMSSAKWHQFCLCFNVLRHLTSLTHQLFVNSLWPSGAIWRYRSGSTLAQVMACCLMAPSHYLNQCWLIINEVLWHSSEGNFTGNAQDIYPSREFENY